MSKYDSPAEREFVIWLRIICASLVILILAAAACKVKSAFAYEAKIQTGGSYLKSQNNQADDSWAGSVRYVRPLKDEFQIGLEVEHHGRMYFPSVDDPKGAFGSLSGYGVMPELIYAPEVPNSKWEPYLLFGVGYYWWNFYENPFLQDNKVTVSVDPAVAFKAGAGVDYWLNEAWAIHGEAVYFTTKIPKDARDNTGRVWNILGDEDIENEEYLFTFGFSYVPKAWRD